MQMPRTVLLWESSLDPDSAFWGNVKIKPLLFFMQMNIKVNLRVGCKRA